MDWKCRIEKWWEQSTKLGIITWVCYKTIRSDKKKLTKNWRAKNEKNGQVKALIKKYVQQNHCIRYSASIVEWTIEDIKRMRIRSRKIMIMNGAFHPTATIGTMYFKSCEGGRVLLSVEESKLTETIKSKVKIKR